MANPKWPGPASCDRDFRAVAEAARGPRAKPCPARFPQQSARVRHGHPRHLVVMTTQGLPVNLDAGFPLARGERNAVSRRRGRSRRLQAAHPPLTGRGLQLCELLFLHPAGGEVLWRQPALKGGPAGRPFGFQHSEPGGVPAEALDDPVVAEDALESQAQAQGSPARCGVEGIAFPLIAAIAERLERVARQQILRLGRQSGALQ